MGYSSGLISAPVSISDVQNAVGYSGGGDLGTIIANGSINKWAKYKPVRLASKDTVTGQWDSTNKVWLSSATWWKADGMCGMATTVASEFGDPTNSSSFAYKLIHGLLGWAYNKPSGGSLQPYRLQDFARYDHTSQKPYGDIGSTTIYIDSQGAGQIDWEVVDVDSNNLALSDFAVPDPNGGSAKSLTDFYLGLILYRNNTWFLFTSSTKFTTGASLSVNLSNMSSYTGTWNCVPFFTRYQVNSQGGFDPNGIFLSMADTQPISIELLAHGSNYFDYINGEWNSGGTAVSYDLQIKNETSSSHTYTGITISICKDSIMNNPIATTTLSNVVVGANSTVNKTGTISVSMQSGHIYWIVATDNTYGSSMTINNQVEEYSGM